MILTTLLAGAALATQSPQPAENVILIMTDGLRWQEVFGGLQDKTLEGTTHGVKDIAGLKAKWARGDRDERRRTLMPFLWNVVAKQGVVYGDRIAGSRAEMANSFHFSYPGYSEMVVGFADPRIDSNADKPNPNVSVLEWLNQRREFKNRVAVFGGWNVVTNIVNPQRSGLMAWSGIEPVNKGKITDRQRLINDMKRDLYHPHGKTPFDSITFESGFEFLKSNRPRVMWLALHDTDAFGHDGNYDQYLEAAKRADNMIQRIWEWVESTPGYRGRTNLILTTDHGRGNDEKGDWRHHGATNAGSNEVWIAALGPNVRKVGVATSGEVKVAQVASTIAAMLGFDYLKVEPKAMPPLPATESPKLR